MLLFGIFNSPYHLFNKALPATTLSSTELDFIERLSKERSRVHKLRIICSTTKDYQNLLQKKKNQK